MKIGDVPIETPISRGFPSLPRLMTLEGRTISTLNGFGHFGSTSQRHPSWKLVQALQIPRDPAAPKLKGSGTGVKFVLSIGKG